ncbi:MAG: GDP-L-fucose synthase [Alphaproteobacteria bacterium]|nr:GDP-L-fucose synthase [Alphaproteobacteria bacterium]
MRPRNLFHLEGKKIWVAGETGMVGRALIRRLQSENTIILSAPHSFLNLTDQAEVHAWMAVHKPEVIVMAAGKVGGIAANNDYPADFLFQNLSMAQNVIHAAFQYKVEKLLYLGSSCVYPKTANQPIKEEALLTGLLEQTNEAYAVAKITGLKLCEYYKKQYGCDFISAMPTNLYGSYDHFGDISSHVIPAIISKIHHAKMYNESSVILWGTGTPYREFLYVDDLADGLVHLLKYYSDNGSLNIGSGKEISIQDLANLVADIVGYQGVIEFDSSKPDGAPRKFLDCSKMKQLGWCAKTPLQQVLQETYQWFLQNS